MNKLRPLDIAHKFCRCIALECTGSRTELAEYLRISPAQINTYKNKLELIYGITIHYSRKRQTYFVNDKDLHKLPPLFRMTINYDKIQSKVWVYCRGLYLYIQNQRLILENY